MARSNLFTFDVKTVTTNLQVFADLGLDARRLWCKHGASCMQAPTEKCDLSQLDHDPRGRWRAVYRAG